MSVSGLDPQEFDLTDLRLAWYQDNRINFLSGGGADFILSDPSWGTEPMFDLDVDTSAPRGRTLDGGTIWSLANFCFSCLVLVGCFLVVFCLCFCLMFWLFAPGNTLEKFS